MRYLVSGKEMKLLDQNTSNCFKVPELVLMEQAAFVFIEKLFDILDGKLKKGIVFCGTGNNGADGMAIARLLNERDVKTDICKLKEACRLQVETSESYKVQESICDAYQFSQVTDIEFISKEDYDFVIDAVFGIGLSRNLGEEYLQMVDFINSIHATKIAVDMPSGINSDNGQVMGRAVSCDYTITFSFEKLGQYLWPGCDYAGHVIVADMGITMLSWLDRKPMMAYLQENDLKELPVRPAHSNKGTFGKLLIIAGSTHMAGAAILSAKAAYNNGTGLVKIFTNEANRSIIQTAVPEAIVATYGNSVEQEELMYEIKWADAIVVGPGLGRTAVSEEIVAFVCKNATVPVVLDADALNIISNDKELLLASHTEFVVTPHIGEFSRLTGKSIAWIQNNLVDSAIEFAKTYDIICVLKDFHTVIAKPEGLNYLNLSGNNGMATAGSGDALAGVIGAFLAQGHTPSNAAAYGVYVHGLAGDMARSRMGTYGVTASDIIHGIKEVWNKVENQ